MPCEEKNRLGAEYEAAVGTFATAVSDLQRKTATSPKAEYERLTGAANESRERAEQARLTLEAHVVGHGC